MFDIQEELKKLPQKFGVYIMKNADGHIIYVGKAINLRSRVRQYFQASSSAQNAKVAAMVRHIIEFEYIVTDNEIEALILECNLIKKHRPKYNIMLKDDKSYPYLKLTVNENFPKIFITRSHKKDGAKYYGPYTSALKLRETLALINKIWPLRRCAKKIDPANNRERFCLNYDLGLCKAPCVGLISQDDYGKMVDEVIEFINGKHESVLKKMERQMRELSENMEFEKAAEIRDTINAVRQFDEKQKIEGSPGSEQDVVAFAVSGEEALVQVFFIRGGKMTGREYFMLDGVTGMSESDVMTEFVKQFYSDTTYIPRELILQSDINDRELIIKFLSGIKEQGVTLTVPQKGEKHRLVGLAQKNAELLLTQFGEKIKRDREKTVGALEEIKKALGFGEEISLERIEAYDISNTQGFESVGSMVVFENGKSKPSDYRKFKIKEVFGANDYASMEEVIHRRFLRYENNDVKFSTPPDIIFIDGGVGQVHSAEKVLDEMGLNIPVCGMVKDDKHRTRGLMYGEREYGLKDYPEGFKLVTRIQDEVHRFAIEYHRKLRDKKQIRSVLDEIDGVGEKRRRALFRHFGSIEKIKAAEVEALAAAPTMNAKIAENVYAYFRT